VQRGGSLGDGHGPMVPRPLARIASLAHLHSERRS
jgi:hypothetical protein